MTRLSRVLHNARVAADRQPFGQLLRAHRFAAGLTQERLAERAGISTRGVQDLERGLAQPLAATLQRLLDALPLSIEERIDFELAARPRPRRRVPAPRVLPPPSNLPLELTHFIGRDRELEQVSERLRAHRLVTLTGPGGVGKTRLALQLARSTTHAYRDGVWVADLTRVGTEDLAVPFVAAVLGVSQQTDRSPEETLVALLRPLQGLLILDNCEHLVLVCANLVHELLRQCSELRILATSREPLAVVGEAVHRIPPLSTPSTHDAPPEQLLRSDGVALFVDRARLVAPDFELNSFNASAVARVCSALDGLPLAIELAAARVNALSVQQLAHLLDDRFRLLSGGARTMPPRHQTMRATLDWSYDLLDQAERQLFGNFAVFPGSATLEAIDTVCSGDQRESDVYATLGRLVDRSLVLVTPQRGGVNRYHMLETVRHYAAERLEQRPDWPRLRLAHAHFYAALAREGDVVRDGPDMSAWLERVAAEHPNISAALEVLLQSGEVDLALEIACSLSNFWSRHDAREGRRWLERALHTDQHPAPRLRARALNLASWFAARLGETESAELQCQAGLELRRELGDDAAIADSLHTLGSIAGMRGRLADADRMLHEALAISRARGDQAQTAYALGNLARFALSSGDVPRAEVYATEALETWRMRGFAPGIAFALGGLAWAAYWRGDLGLAEERGAEYLALAREHGDPTSITDALAVIGDTLLARGALPEAAGAIGEALIVRASHGELRGCVDLLAVVAELALASAQADRAAVLMAAHDAIYAARDLRSRPSHHTTHQGIRATARRELGQLAFERAWAAGERLTVDDAVAFATQTLWNVRPADASVSVGVRAGAGT